MRYIGVYCISCKNTRESFFYLCYSDDKKDNFFIMIKRCFRKDFITTDKDFFLEKKNFVFEDICFLDINKNKTYISVQFIIDHINEIALKYKISLDTIDIALIVFDFISMSDETITYFYLNEKLSFIAATYIEKHYNYSKLASSFLIEAIMIENVCFFDIELHCNNFVLIGKDLFKKSIIYGVKENIFDSMILTFDLDFLAEQLDFSRDCLFDYIGIYTLQKRFFIKNRNKKTFEHTQGFWMRIAMGLALQEEDKNKKAKEFYDVLSQLHYLPSTPTLCHSGLIIPQLSSCYLTVVQDDLSDIFVAYGHSAQLAKWSGGIATAWTPVRACGAYIKKINLESQGVIPYLKIEDDIISSISKTGTRRGGKAVYLEVWHYDIEEFLDLKKNTGDHRRRTHDLNTALWVSDLFMERVLLNGSWTLFSPDETPLLLTTFGKNFVIAYEQYEALALQGGISLFKVLPAKMLWKKILTRIFETGHPWITFKDVCNIRSPQQHAGIINSSNLCTEITLNTSKDEIAVCNLGSINLKAHINEHKRIDFDKLKSTIINAMRMLDNVIDITYYPVDIAKNSNMKHRPVGLGVMGWQDVLFEYQYAFESDDAANLINQVSEFISFNAINESSNLALERGSYDSFINSLWSQGFMPHDSVSFLANQRNVVLDMPCITPQCDWAVLKEKIKKQGMRNSNTQAIAPTATISTIAGCYPSIEPLYKNVYVKSNITGEFAIINKYLIDELMLLGLWNKQMADKIKFYDGSILLIDEIPMSIRMRYKTAFEIDQKVLIHLTALRGQWIDQSQSHNIFFSGASGKVLEEIYLSAWRKGLKTSYYLRTLGKSQIEKSTLGTEYGLTQKRSNYEEKIICSIENKEECQSCQ